MVEATSIDLQGLVLLEEDISGGHCDAVWRYPKVPASLCSALTSRWKDEGWGETVLADAGDSASASSSAAEGGSVIAAAAAAAEGPCPCSDVFIGRVEGGGWYYVKHYAGTVRPVAVSGARSFAVACTASKLGEARGSPVRKRKLDLQGQRRTQPSLRSSSRVWTDTFNP